MPTGQKTIVWTAENDERLLLSIMGAHNITVNYDKVAQVFGNNIAPSVIRTRMGKLKAKARALNPGVVSTTAAVTAPGTTATKRKPMTKKNDGATTKKVKQEATDEEEDNMDDLIGAQINNVPLQHVTPPATPSKKSNGLSTKASNPNTPSPAGGDGVLNGRVGKKRSSPRDSSKPNYRQLDDPFVSMPDAMDEDGNNIFGTPARTESEDSFATDKDFDAEKFLD
ncbi:MAG: hypothetical protein M1830_008063 [Pleopsidium flavum]|nr:MAG: hypothetical protein M1830_008063 [Pleopsidium flavum]